MKQPWQQSKKSELEGDGVAAEGIEKRSWGYLRDDERKQYLNGEQMQYSDRL
ncbi:6872_t:CDS:2 [Funneliformis mosseae]|uniref:6872_t:CDS:1 n=1 Tax=Funneliformis mosseae TaxID=27381 RepID=A0A9N9H2S8_FUNMO|nr:6872_t:CDS:2 [Funneliformis mosseae]